MLRRRLKGSSLAGSLDEKLSMMSASTLQTRSCQESRQRQNRGSRIFCSSPHASRRISVITHTHFAEGFGWGPGPRRPTRHGAACWMLEACRGHVPSDPGHTWIRFLGLQVQFQHPRRHHSTGNAATVPEKNGVPLCPVLEMRIVATTSIMTVCCVHETKAVRERGEHCQCHSEGLS